MKTPTPPLYCTDLFHYSRRNTREVNVGHVGIGGENPIRVQSMITSDTRDTAACVAETLALADAGCEIVRITAQTRIYAANLEHIARGVRAAGCDVPLVADIHFKPDAALEAAKWVEKVRVNPGNYADKKKFEVREYTDGEYAAEIDRIREQFVPLVQVCKDLGRAMRIGTNHGSLSDRIMNRFGDTPLGMVESALEFAHIARDEGYHNFVFSMKASNPKVMIQAYRLLVARLIAEGPDWNYPIHLGVTEAGDGEDGRIKSAVGIGSLLADGIGDTIRVSLTEDSVHEIPVAQELVKLDMNRSWDLQSQSVAGTSCPEPKAVAGTCSPSPSVGTSCPDLTTLAQTIRPDWSQLQKRTSSHLPHWRIPGATYAVTFRIKDSLPASVFREHERQKNALLERISQIIESAGSRDATAELLPLRHQIQSLTETLIEPALHAADGPKPLADPRIAESIEGALKFFDGQRYDLLAWSVMPNHVHAILTPREDHPLEKIIQSWKTHTAKEANRILGKSETFWQEEYYDHIVRDGEDLKHQVQYILRNPLMGGASATWTGSAFGTGCPERRTGTASPSYDSELVGTGCPDDGLGLQVPATLSPPFDPYSYERRHSSVLEIMGHSLGGDQTLRVFTIQARWNALAHKIAGMGDYKPEIILEKSRVLEIDPCDEVALSELNSEADPRLITVADGLPIEPIHAFRMLAAKADPRHPILLKDTLTSPSGETDFLHALLVASRNIGSLLCDGIGDAVIVRGEIAPGQSLRLAYNILQAAGARIFKTDYVACPSCGRTLFNLQSTTQKIRAATGHLKGVRIAVMGCIVNGPGEMADADFGYVGGAPGKINLYVGKTAVKFNIPEAEAVERLIDLIREHGRWIDAPEPAATS
jgi:1-hydroxy-2-methyl-2-(E)-butenyl 4-diphosphate synthase